MSSQSNQAVWKDGIPFFTSVKTQLIYKLKIYHNTFGILIFLHLFGAILGFFNESYISFSNYLEINIALISNDTAFLFTVLMMFIFGIQLTTKTAKNLMVTFVTDKDTNNTANALLIGIVSAFGAVTLSLLGIFIRMVSYYIFSMEKVLFVDSITIKGMIITVIAMFFIFYICGGLGYLVGELVQLHKVFIVIVPVLIFGFEPAIGTIVESYADTTTLSLFVLKLFVTLFFVLTLAFVLGKKLEVRR